MPEQTFKGVPLRTKAEMWEVGRASEPWSQRPPDVPQDAWDLWSDDMKKSYYYSGTTGPGGGPVAMSKPPEVVPAESYSLGGVGQFLSSEPAPIETTDRPYAEQPRVAFDRADEERKRREAQRLQGLMGSLAI